ncbi:O-antigen polysaccharide polymerase Wzy, partial [Vibrio pomeroyi]
ELRLIAYSFIFSVPSFYWILNIISVHGIEGFMANRIVLLSGGGFYLAIFKLGQVVSTAVFANQLLRKKVFNTKINYTVLSIALLLAILPALLQGSRSQIFVPIVSYVTAYLLIANNGLVYINRIKKFLIFGFVILVIAINLGSVRQAIMADNLDNFSDYNNESIVKKMSYNYGSSENLLYLYDNNKPSELLYGQSYLAALVGFVPRAFWSEKPLGGGPFMKNQISENSYDLTSGQNISSVTTGALAEAYINFGMLGVFLGPIITITAIFIFYQMSLLLHGPLFISCYSLLVFRFFGYVNGEFFGVTSHIIAILFFGFFCYIILSFKFKYE